MQARGGERKQIKEQRDAKIARLKKDAPDLVPDVLAGRMGLQAAADVAREGSLP